MIFTEYTVIELALLAIAFSIGVQLILNYTNNSYGLTKFIENKRILVITAHPDDECMFFAPTLLQLTACPSTTTYLLCFSKGNYYGEGHKRNTELIASCKILGIPSGNVHILDNSKFPDDPNINWNYSLIAEKVIEFIRKYQIHVVVTFDQCGVSGHKNHCSLYEGVKVIGESAAGREVTVLLLDTVPLWRKYTGVLDLVPSLFTSSILCISTWPGVFKAQAAMLAHRSQVTWFRLLYIVFSRYMIINTLRPIDTDTAVHSAST